MPSPTRIDRELRKWFKQPNGDYEGEVWMDRLGVYIDGGVIRISSEMIQSVSDYGAHFLVKTFTICYILYRKEQKK